MLDAYTIKKIAPRLLIAAIGINLSIYFCVAAIDIANVIGHALANLIVQPFADAQQLEIRPDTGGTTLAGFLLIGTAIGGIIATVLTLGGAGAGGIPAIFFILLPIVIIVLAIIMVVVIRQALLVILTIFSPIAIVCLVLPGTEKYFKQWWDLFLKTLLVYPIIAVLFAVSNVMAMISFNASNAGDIANTQSAAQIIGGVVLSFLPLVMIPFAFRFAGGAIGTIMGSTRGMMGKINRYSGRKREGYMQRGIQKSAGGSLFGTGNRFNRRMSSMARTAHLAPGAALSARPRERLARIRQDSDAIAAGRLLEDKGFQSGAQFDDLVRAGAAFPNRREQERYLMEHDAGGIWQDPSRRRAGVEWIQQQISKEGYGAFQEASIGALAPNSTGFATHADAVGIVGAMSGGDPAKQVANWVPISKGQQGAGRYVVAGGSVSQNLRHLQEFDQDMAEHGEYRPETQARHNSEAARSAWGRDGGARAFVGKPVDAKALADQAFAMQQDIERSIATGENMELYSPHIEDEHGNVSEGYEPRPATEADRLANLAKIHAAHENVKYSGAENQSQMNRLLNQELGGTARDGRARTMGSEMREAKNSQEFSNFVAQFNEGVRAEAEQHHAQEFNNPPPPPES